MFSHIEQVIIELLYILFEKSAQICDHFMDTEIGKSLTFRIDRKSFMIDAHLCGF